jgi:hypothetical protein
MKKLMIMLAAASVVLAGAAPAQARGAVVNRQTVRGTFTEDDITDDCLPGASGSLAARSVATEQTVETPTGFRLTGVEVDTGRIEWTNGVYAIVGSTDHYTYGGPQSTFEYTNAHKDYGDFYAGDGTFLFRETYHAIEHLTVTNGIVTRVDFYIDHAHIFGGGCHGV